MMHAPLPQSNFFLRTEVKDESTLMPTFISPDSLSNLALTIKSEIGHTLSMFSLAGVSAIAGGKRAVWFNTTK